MKDYAYYPRRSGPYLREVLADVDLLFRLPEEDATELLLVRHAEPAPLMLTAPNDDPLLSCTGLAQSERLADRLRSLWCEAVYVAPERRARQTATLIGDALDLEPVVIDDLHEVAYTRWGAGPRTLKSCIAPAQPLVDDPRWDVLTGFESSAAFRNRAVTTIRSLVEAHPGRRIVVVGHASLLNAVVASALGLANDLFFSPDYASITTLRLLDGRAVLRGLNDVTHLSALPRSDLTELLPAVHPR